VWAAHFLATYATAAVWCGRWADQSRTLGPAGLIIAVYTVVALATIGGLGWYGFRAHRHLRSLPPHDADSPEDRHRFIGLATMLLAGLSALAVSYSALAVWLSGTCL
jgi:uncharacterized iron-regulated membrane protein